jgi:hypothetical protein
VASSIRDAFGISQALANKIAMNREGASGNQGSSVSMVASSSKMGLGRSSALANVIASSVVYVNAQGRLSVRPSLFITDEMDFDDERELVVVDRRDTNILVPARDWDQRIDRQEDLVATRRDMDQLVDGENENIEAEGL